MVSIFSPDWRNEILRQMSTYLTQADGDARYLPEIGTWTPTLAFGGASTGITYGSSNAGHYRKIGQLVFLAGAVQLTNKGSSTGSATINGIPFASNSSSGSGTSGTFQVAINMNLTGVQVPYLLIGANATALQLFYWPGGALDSPLTNVHFNNNSQVNFTLWYIANA